MEYTDWIKPRAFQDDPGFIGKVFAAQIRESGLEDVICRLASETWVRQLVESGHTHEGDPKAVLDPREAWFGKRNVVYRLRMPDNSHWIARLYNALRSKSTMADSTQRNANQRLLFESEVATMHFVREKTQIPVPKVYAYDCTYSNVLGTPYIFMEYIAGKPYPFPFSGQRLIRDEDLSIIHAQLTEFSWQLFKHPFNAIGQIRRAPGGGTDVVVGPIIDRKDRSYGPFMSSRTFYEKRAEKVLEYEENQFSAVTDPNAESSIESAALHVLAAKHAGKESFDTGPFILQHADMHWQNLLFDEDCRIVGVIDWEWAQTVPVDSFNMLPWNFASKMLPFQSDNVARHQQVAIRYFKALFDNEVNAPGHHIVDDMVCFQGSQQQQIARYLDDYNWPESRRKHFNHLKELIVGVESVSWLQFSID